MAHGYLRDYDEGWDRGDERDRDDWRERSDRDWRGDRHRDRGFMLDRDHERHRSRDRDDDRSFFSRLGDDTRSWFRDDEREGGRDRSAWENNRDWPQRNRGTSGYGREHGYGGFQGDYSGRRQQGGFGAMGDQRDRGERYSANPDDHYRSWRDKQMQSLDRDYQDYCREREQQFHQDFDSWRSQRRGNQEPLRPGMTQTAQTGDPTGQNEIENEAAPPGQGEPDPVGNATLGTNNSGNSATGRGRR